MAMMPLGSNSVGFGNHMLRVSSHLESGGESGTCDYLNMPIRTRIDNLVSNKLYKIKYAEIYDHKKHEWVEIPKNLLEGLVLNGISDEYLKKFIEKGADLWRVIGLAHYYQKWSPMKLEGNALWDKILNILDLPELDNFDPTTMLKCEVTEPSNPNVLILGAVSDHNGALKLDKKNKYQFYKVLANAYNICYKYVTDKVHFCREIDEFAAKRPINALIINAHGNQEGIQLLTDALGNEVGGIHTTDIFPERTCLKKLAPEATIVLHSCSTGKGMETSNNIANHIHNNAPPGTRVIAPITGIHESEVDILGIYPLEVRYSTYLYSDDTYRVDKTLYKEKDKYWNCRNERSISYLNFCQNQPLLRHIQFDGKKKVIFYVSATDYWSRVDEETFELFLRRGFDNNDLVRLSKFGINLNQFYKIARNYPKNLRPNEMIDRAFEEILKEKSTWGIVRFVQSLFGSLGNWLNRF